MGCARKPPGPKFFLGTPEVDEKQLAERRRERDKSQCQQWPATLATATMDGARKPP